MSATTVTPRPAVRSRWLGMVRWQTIGHWVIFGGFLITAVLAIILILILVSRTTTPTLSGFAFAPQIGMWMPFAVAIHFVTSWFGPAVAAGMTRGNFVRAAVTAVLALAASGAPALYVLLRLEPFIYEWRGWTPRLVGGRVSPADASLPIYLWGLFLLLAIAGLAGLLVGLTYARLGAWATLLLPLTLLPLIGVCLLALDPAAMFSPVTVTTDTGPWRPPTLGLGFGPARLLLGVAFIGASIAIIQLLARRHPIRGAGA